MYSQFLRTQDFSLLALTQFCATLGHELYDIGMMVVIFADTNSVLESSGVLVAKLTPAILLGPLAGVMVDRYPHKWVMGLMNLLRAILVLLALFLSAKGSINLWWIYTIVAALAVADAFHKPAQQALVPRLARSEGLVQANGVLTLVTLFALGTAFLLAGWLPSQFGIQTLIWFNLTCFLAATVFVLNIAVQPQLAPTSVSLNQSSIGRSFAEGLAYLRQHNLARALITIEMLEQLSDSMWISTITLAFVQQVLHAGAEVWGLQNSLYYVGQALGSVIALLLAQRFMRRPGRFILVDTTVTTILNLLYALSPNVPFALWVCFAFGPPAALREVVQNALLQSVVSPEVLGRIYSLRQMLLNLILMLGGVGFGWLADQLPVFWIMLGGTACYAMAMGYAWIHPAIRCARLQVGSLLEATQRSDIDAHNYQPIL